MGFLCIILIIVCLLAWRQYNKGINHKINDYERIYAGAMYTEFVSGKKWTWKKHVNYILIIY